MRLPGDIEELRAALRALPGGSVVRVEFPLGVKSRGRKSLHMWAGSRFRFTRLLGTERDAWFQLGIDGELETHCGDTHMFAVYLLYTLPGRKKLEPDVMEVETAQRSAA